MPHAVGSSTLEKKAQRCELQAQRELQIRLVICVRFREPAVGVYVRQIESGRREHLGQDFFRGDSAYVLVVSLCVGQVRHRALRNVELGQSNAYAAEGVLRLTPRLGMDLLLQYAEVLLQSASRRIERFVTLVPVPMVAEQCGALMPVPRLQHDVDA